MRAVSRAFHPGGNISAAPVGRILGALSSTFEIREHGSCPIAEGDLPLLRRAIGKLSSFDRMTPVNVDMGDVIGTSALVVIRPGDDVYWALTEGESNRPENWIRVVGNRNAEPTSIVGLQMNYERMGGSDDFPYDGRLIAWSRGPFPLPHPRRDFVNPAYVRSLVDFWKKHAFAASSLCDRRIGTRKNCPWQVDW